MGLLDLAEQLRKTAPLMDAIGKRTLADLKATFLEEEDPSGRMWAPLNPEYDRRKLGPSILMEEGHLFRSLAYERRRTSVTIGPRKGSPSHRYQRIHQQGGTAGLGKVIPARPYIGATNAHAARAVNTMLDHIRATPKGTP